MTTVFVSMPSFSNVRLRHLFCKVIVRFSYSAYHSFICKTVVIHIASRLQLLDMHSEKPTIHQQLESCWREAKARFETKTSYWSRPFTSHSYGVQTADISRPKTSIDIGVKRQSTLGWMYNWRHVQGIGRTAMGSHSCPSYAFG